MLLKSFLLFSLTIYLISLPATANQMVKSPNDTRTYESFSLQNQLKVVVISDPQTDKAAVSLDLDVGSASNPIDRPGLAHFLEHMLFLGTKKYPLADDYSRFIDTNGGSHNAFTSQDNTNYFFDIKDAALAPALDRFSQFFIAPLFSQKYTQREKQAVHSEYQSRLKDDSQRNYSVFKQLMNPEHPGSRFFIGSLETLSDTKESKIRDDLIDFYQRYYSANRMTLVILGQQPVADLKALAIKYFSAIQNNQVAAPAITQPRFRADQLPKIIKVKTLKDFRLLTLTFPLPSTKHLYRQKPLYYLTSLIGYEGDGSLIAYLKAQGYANGLSASSSDESDVESAVQTSISLTQKGLLNKDKVIASFFHFIEKIQRSGIQPQLYKEQQQLAQQAFQFMARQNPSSYVVWLSQTMRKYPQQDWLQANYIMDSFDATSISHLLGYINPQNLLLNIQAKTLETDKVEPYFGAHYASAAVSEAQLTLWNNTQQNPQLFIRKYNPYIANDLSILKSNSLTGLIKDKKSSAQRPTLYEMGTGVRLWHLQDSQFSTPKATLFFSLFMPQQKLTTRQLISLNLYSQLVNDKFNKQFYDAQEAGMYIELYSHSRGMSIKLSGYNDKQPLVIEQLGLIPKVTFDQSRFDILKINYQRALANSLKEKPYQQLFSQLTQHLGGSADTQSKLKVLAKVSLNDVYAMANSMFEAAEVRILSHGNISADQAQKIATTLIDKIDIKKTLRVDNPDNILRLDKGQAVTLTKQIDSSDSAVVLYLQGENKSYQQRAATDLIGEIISTDYSNQLRTEQQLGYLVFATSMNLQKLPGLALVVQSPSASPDEIKRSNQQFLAFVTDKLKGIEPAQLLKYKQSLLSRYQTQERTIYQRSSRFWRELNAQQYAFNQQQALISATQQLTLNDLLQTWGYLAEKTLQSLSYSNALYTSREGRAKEPSK